MTDSHDQYNGGNDDGADLRAAEYVLGLLDAAAYRQAQAQVERDPAFAAEVANWENSFAPWLGQVPPAPVPDVLWQRIRQTLWGHELPQRDAMAPIAAKTPLSQSLGFWRGLAAAGAAVAVASVALLLTNYRTPGPAPTPPPQVVTITPPPAAAQPLIVSLRHEDGTTAYTATLNPDDGSVVLVPVHLGGDPTLSPELWLIPPGESPRSLGMIARDAPMVVTVPTALRGTASSGGTFAISLEPAGSGPHQAPTGPVIATGTSIQLAP